LQIYTQQLLLLYTKPKQSISHFLLTGLLISYE